MRRRTEESPLRDKARTRLAVLEAAERLFAQRGNGVSLAEIATAAGVTKGGLMHHFPSREALIDGVGEHVLDSLWTRVHDSIDLSENRPGKFARAYIRTLTSGEEFVTRLFSPSSMFVTLGTTPRLEEMFTHDARRLDEAFVADGLPLARALVIRFAAEGLAAAGASAYLTDEQVVTARAELLAMTEIP